MADDGNHSDRDRPANDDRSPVEEEGAGKADASEKLDAVVLSIARLIGRQMAREDFETLWAANDNRNGSASDDDG
ncbi:hypothetical protein [Rhizobium sp. AG207R]|uniref:hypothetical protein n=1 Tax=Rhizobium sp. AG207R TaxID=2802287 RepID=UPI0022AC23EC|nr:hypothetical protein [Rhizobium sp. AG207R]MCZ3379054.1 hypothetical protein [Rhizobium sp. AG207R]